jgi:phosphomannomutase/phosphoglucomutase
MMLAGETLSGEAIQDLRRRVEADDFGPAPSAPGRYSTAAVRVAYLERVTGDIKLARPLRVVVDCGNGSPGAIAPELFRRLGCEVTELFCDVDGTFPNHHPDPSDPHNLKDLIAELARGKADIGLAFDGDGDRLGVATRAGKVIFADRQLMLFAADVLARNPGAEVIFDIKCTRHLCDWIAQHGGKPTLWKTGHSLIKAKMRETGALLAGEMSGHTFFKERWYGFDDGLYAGARLLEILSKVDDIDAVFDALPDSVNTPEMQIRVEGRDHHALIAQLQREASFPSAREVITLDGLRVEYADGFGLVRGSNTTPVLVLRFEADSVEALARIQAEFRQVLAVAEVEAGF